MASAWLREIQDSTVAFGTGMTFYFRCLAYFLVEILGFTDFSEGAGFGGVLGYAKNGTNGEFNLSGSDKQFRDSVAGSFASGDVGSWVVVVDPVRSNAGIYKITSFVSATTVVLDFRSGATEYPSQTTGLDWYMITPDEASATGSITCHPGTSIVDGEFVKIEDGVHLNNSKVVIVSSSGSGYSPNQWRGAIVAGSDFNQNNLLSGKKLYIEVAGSGGQMTFTGASPLGIDDVVSQINTYVGALGPAAYRSDFNGYPSATGTRISFAVGKFGDWGQPDDPPSTADNDVSLTYSLSDAWSDLGLTGTGDLTTPNLSQSHSQFQSTLLPDPPGPASAADISAWMTGQINGATALEVTATDAGGSVNLSNNWPGTHGNRSLIQSNYSVSGMSGGIGLTIVGGWFSCKSPSSKGWAIRVGLAECLDSTRVMWRVEVSTNGIWDAGAKIIGPVYSGIAVSSTAWLYAEGDDEGHWLNILFHQSSSDYYLGMFISELLGADSEREDHEEIALHGITSGSAAYNTDRTSCYRNDDDTYWGHGVRWDESIQVIRDIYMMELSYANYDYGLTQWISRESNARLTSALGYTAEDAILGTAVIQDYQNAQDAYEITGILQGHYSCRANLSPKTAHGHSGGQNTIFHWFDGWAIFWPGFTPQH